MAEVGRFFDGVSYSEADQAEVQARMVRDGVLVGIANELAVTIGGGFANVNTGEAFVQGFWYKNTASKAIAIPGNVSATPRIDLVVLALDRVANTLVATLHQGVVGGGTPALTQVVGGNYEILLATLSTASSVTTLTDARLWQPDMFSPFTAQNDIIVADASKKAVRLAAGSNGAFLGKDIDGNFGYFAPPQPSGVYNGNFEEGSTAAATLSAAGWTSICAGWWGSKGAAGDVVTAQVVVPGVDIPYGGSRALLITKTGTAGTATILQWAMDRIVRAYANRTVTITARIWSTAVGLAQVYYYNGSTSTTGSLNTTASLFETISLTLNTGAISTLALGVAMGPAAGSVYIDSIEITVGSSKPISILPASPRNALGVSGNLSATPKCIKTLGSGNYLNAVGSGGVTFAMNSNEVDTDGMGLTAGRITFQTAGRYLCIAFGEIYAASAANVPYGTYLMKNGGAINFDSAASAGGMNMGMWVTGNPYEGTPCVFVDDFNIGDYITMHGVSFVAGQTVSYHYNGTYMGAWIIA